MKKLLFMLFIVWMSVATSYAQLSAGFYGGNQTINLGSSAILEFRFEGAGPVDFSYDDGQYVFIEQGIQTSPYRFEVRPMETTTYHLRKVMNSGGYGHIQEGHEYVTVYVGNGNNVVQTNFLPPSNLCENANPIDLKNYFTSNVSGSVSFSGDGVVNDVFYPQLAGVGSHYIESFLYYNGSTYSIGSNISVDAIPQVSLWLPNEVLENSSPFILSGGSPSGGTYFGDGVVNGNIFDPIMAGVGWHTIYYSYTTATGCQDVAETKIYVRATGFGVDEDEENLGILPYPNPTSGVVYFEMPCSVEVVSQYGVSIFRNNSLQEYVDLSALPAGIYLLRLFDGEKVFIHRIVKV